MVEENYDPLASLDLRQYSGVFRRSDRICRPAPVWRRAPTPYRPPSWTRTVILWTPPSYNAYGDYILYRPDAGEDTPIYGLPVDYTVDAFPQAYYIDPANAEIARFTADGVRVWLTYSPRNSQAVSGSLHTGGHRRTGRLFQREPQRSDPDLPLQDSLLPGAVFLWD